jgi:hypothetical protein
MIAFIENTTVKFAGTPTQLPDVKPIGQIRVSTVGNAGDIYLGTSYPDVQSSQHRFTIAANSNITLPLVVNSLSELWLDAANDGDSLSVICAIQEKGGHTNGGVS